MSVSNMEDPVKTQDYSSFEVKMCAVRSCYTNEARKQSDNKQKRLVLVQLLTVTYIYLEDNLPSHLPTLRLQ